MSSKYRGVVVQLMAAALFCAGTTLHATLIINPTFDPSLTSQDDAAINSAISVIESDITSPNNISVTIYFSSMSGGLGESITTEYSGDYYTFYQALASLATSPDQVTALASLGAPPANSASPNPVNGSRTVLITSAEARNLGFSFASGDAGPSGTYDSEILLNTNLTTPPAGSLNGSDYSLESVAMHEIDETLGIGGTGSTLGNGSPNGPVGDLDLFRYSAPGVRSYSTTQTTSPFSYFSIDGGVTVLSYFNQTAGADYADWLSNPIPNGFGTQVQDSFATPGTNPVLGPSELAALNVIGYTLTVPEPSTGIFLVSALLAGLLVRRRQVR